MAIDVEAASRGWRRITGRQRRDQANPGTATHGRLGRGAPETSAKLAETTEVEPA